MKEVPKLCHVCLYHHPLLCVIMYQPIFSMMIYVQYQHHKYCVFSTLSTLLHAPKYCVAMSDINQFAVRSPHFSWPTSCRFWFLVSGFSSIRTRICTHLYGVAFVNPANMQAMVKRLFNKDVTSYQKTILGLKWSW